MASADYTIDEKYMRRALDLARLGAGHASPNPMVGAVIVADGRVIGEGWHRRCGQAHAEVNAVNSVADVDRHLLPLSTIYVTLEPCAHYGKTPPCAKLLIDTGIPRVVVGCADPFAKVAGRGIAMLREAGAEVEVGVLEDECEDLNVRFMTAHSSGRPWVCLKWAQTSDGFIGAFDAEGRPVPVAVSNPLTRMSAHRDRSRVDAVLVGTGTVVADNPRLDVRFWPGDSPRPVTFDRRGRLPKESLLASNPRSIVLPDIPLAEALALLKRDYGITSLLVEGGAQMLQSFISQGLYDEVRREVGVSSIGRGVSAPALPEGLKLRSRECVRGNLLEYFVR